MVARGFQSASHPILAQIVPIRRCNLACTYCNEYDKHSPPVPLATMRERLDHLARLRTANIELSGGEPLLHPDLDELIRHIRGNGALAGLITNGYLLNEKRLEDFNDAGLDHLQISIDNVTPDDTSKKSLKVLDAKLQMLAKRAAFSVNINSVLGGDLSNPDDALTIAKRAIELGLTATVGLIHDGHGRLMPLTPEQRGVHREITALTAPFYTVQKQNDFKRNLAFGRPNDWQCGAGGRYLYVCEDGLVHWCSQQRGHPGIPLAEYTTEDVRRESTSEKSCAPLCTVSCVHRVALLDRIRTQPIKTLDEIMPATAARNTIASAPSPHACSDRARRPSLPPIDSYPRAPPSGAATSGARVTVRQGAYCCRDECSLFRRVLGPGSRSVPARRTAPNARSARLPHGGCQLTAPRGSGGQRPAPAAGFRWR
jgi:MoaA/NifB/PqqE/SkfB family radical SAM enzyme